MSGLCAFLKKMLAIVAAKNFVFCMSSIGCTDVARPHGGWSRMEETETNTKTDGIIATEQMRHIFKTQSSSDAKKCGNCITNDRSKTTVFRCHMGLSCSSTTMLRHTPIPSCLPIEATSLPILIQPTLNDVLHISVQLVQVGRGCIAWVKQQPPEHSNDVDYWERIQPSSGREEGRHAEFHDDDATPQN